MGRFEAKHFRSSMSAASEECALQFEAFKTHKLDAAYLVLKVEGKFVVLDSMGAKVDFSWNKMVADLPATDSRFVCIGASPSSVRVRRTTRDTRRVTTFSDARLATSDIVLSWFCARRAAGPALDGSTAAPQTTRST